MHSIQEPIWQTHKTVTPQKLGCDLALLKEIRGVQPFLCAG
jgi:hypothetical protein